MSVIVIGDVAAEDSYHLGDEAMTEMALDALQARGATDITVVAKAPSVAEKRFGTGAVPRIGFAGMSASKQKARLAAVQAAAIGGQTTTLPATDPAWRVIEAFREASGLVIAGGGNVSSSFSNHLFERLALSRLARHFDVPVAISSQTFGPLFWPEHEPLLAELFSLATAIGTREGYSHALVNRVKPQQVKSVHTLDDAAWLEPREADVQRLATLGVPERFLIASLTYHRGTTGISREEYFGGLARTFDLLAQRFDLHVLLVPHVGAFEPARASEDRWANEQIVSHSQSGRVVAMPLLTAREDIALTRKAELSLSTRYHPTVFGPSNEVPSLCITTSYYSSVRMFGALSNVGCGDLAIPWEVWTPELVADAVAEILERRDAVRGHLRQIVQTSKAQSERWWDAIADTVIRGRAFADVPAFSSPSSFPFSGEWTQKPRIARPVSDLHARARVFESRERSLLEQKIKSLEKNLAREKKAKRVVANAPASPVRPPVVVSQPPPAPHAQSASSRSPLRVLRETLAEKIAPSPNGAERSRQVTDALEGLVNDVLRGASDTLKRARSGKKTKR